MKLRCAIHLNGRSENLQLFSNLQETADHLVLKLAASLFFFEHHPTIEHSPAHPALQGQDFWPDLLTVDLTNQVTLWVECGKTTLHKLGKASKRYRQARVIVLTPSVHQGQQQAQDVQAEGLRVEVWAFQEGEYDRWRSLVKERNDIVGEATETALNLVINDAPFMTDLKRLG